MNVIMKNFARLFLLLLPVLILVLTIGAIYMIMNKKRTLKKHADDQNFRKITVEYIIAKSEDTTLSVNSQGLAKPRTEINLIPEVSGIITYRAPQFQKGGSFKKGEILLKIEDKNYRSNVLRKKASLKQAEQSLIREQAEARIALEDWKEFAEQESPSDLALRKPQLEEAKARILAAQADLRNAEIELERTIIRAPFAGQVRNRSVDIGQYVSVGQNLGKIFSTDIIEIELPLTDQDLAQLTIPITFQSNAQTPGPKVLLSAIFAGQERHWVGELVRMDSALDNQTRTIQAIVEVKGSYHVKHTGKIPLIPGLFVEGQIQGKTVHKVFILPRAALRGKNQIYKINAQNELIIVETNILATTKENIIVKTNINSEDKIAVTPLFSVYSGLNVKPIPKQEINQEQRVINITNEYIGQ